MSLTIDCMNGSACYRLISASQSEGVINNSEALDGPPVTHEQQHTYFSKSIETITGNRSRFHRRSFGVNHSNLIRVNTNGLAQGRMINVPLLNARSICNKTADIQDFIIENNVDILCITETWLKNDGTENVILTEVVPPGYSVLSVPREEGRGGGVAIIYNKSLHCKRLTKSGYKSFESLECVFTIGSHSLRFVTVYRPPGGGYGEFHDDFTACLEDTVSAGSIPVIVGDFNIQEPNYNKFNDLIRTFSLCQLVSEGTHVGGNMLDLVYNKVR